MVPPKGGDRLGVPRCERPASLACSRRATSAVARRLPPRVLGAPNYHRGRLFVRAAPRRTSKPFFYFT